MKNIIITGASGGIGRALAEKLAELPDTRIFIAARSSAKLHALAGECNLKRQETAVIPITFDLQKDDYATLAETVAGKFGNIDVLINNAGAIVNKDFALTTPEEFDSLFAVNVKAPYFLIRELLPYLKNPSHIVNITSMGGLQGSVKFPGLSAYSASKGALGILTECLAEELKEKGISVNALAIGSVNTEMLSTAFPGYKAPVDPPDMAGFIAWFALNGNQFFNGKILPVSVSTP